MFESYKALALDEKGEAAHRTDAFGRVESVSLEVYYLKSCVVSILFTYIGVIDYTAKLK